MLFALSGLIISTPTGSTAYSMAAGASMLHPSLPAIMVTPINPHSLSCRPLGLPVGIRLEVQLADDGRSKFANVACDGRPCRRRQIVRGDLVCVTASPYPVPCLCSENQVSLPNVSSYQIVLFHSLQLRS
ncbi:unnamed protein product [Protopolystoma xenopodis]|uniref:Uncharacterized protein n=1 Tax=Protopolystoma xenopodis TaxID=117903 RepID=A0A3S5FED7_9PLAT|nr:unnamed protein product [Protopolystoma xenopodis]